MTFRRTTMLAPVAAVVLLAGAATAASGGEPGPPPSVAWQGCADGAVQCGSVSVPVDHAEPDGDRIDLAIARLPAQDPATRRGTIVFHPGGPGPALKAVLDPRHRAAFTELTRWFDVVAFDSRGYGQSNPICDPALAPPFLILDSPESYAQRQQDSAVYGESCRRGHPTLVDHVSAEDTAHDIDAIRGALGEEQILFYGNSYGTVFGQEYAEHYGHRLKRLYLDSVADHTASYLADKPGSALAMEESLHRFAQTCSADPGCALHGADVLAVWDEVVAAAEERPLPAADGTEVSATLIRWLSGSNNAAANPNGIGAALAQARDGDGSGFAAMVANPPIMDGGQLTDCADFPVRPDDYQELMAAGDQLREEAPRVGWLAPLIGARWCAGWPLPATNEPTPLDAPVAPPALLVNVTDDPGRTHIHAAQHVTEQLEGSVLLTVTGFGHALYWNQPANRCIRDTVHRYLLDGVLPEPGAQCSL